MNGNKLYVPKPDLFQMILAHDAARRFASRLYRRQQDTNHDPCDCEYSQQLDDRKRNP